MTHHEKESHQITLQVHYQIHNHRIFKPVSLSCHMASPKYILFTPVAEGKDLTFG